MLSDPWERNGTKREARAEDCLGDGVPCRERGERRKGIEEVGLRKRRGSDNKLWG